MIHLRRRALFEELVGDPRRRPFPVLPPRVVPLYVRPPWPCPARGPVCEHHEGDMGAQP